MFRFRSAHHFVDVFRDNYGPPHSAFAVLDARGAADLRADLLELAAGYDRGGPAGSIALEAAYLVSVAERAPAPA